MSRYMSKTENNNASGISTFCGCLGGCNALCTGGCKYGCSKGCQGVCYIGVYKFL